MTHSLSFVSCSHWKYDTADYSTFLSNDTLVCWLSLWRWVHHPLTVFVFQIRLLNLLFNCNFSLTLPPPVRASLGGRGQGCRSSPFPPPLHHQGCGMTIGPRQGCGMTLEEEESPSLSSTLHHQGHGRAGVWLLGRRWFRLFPPPSTIGVVVWLLGWR